MWDGSCVDCSHVCVCVCCVRAVCAVAYVCVHVFVLWGWTCGRDGFLLGFCVASDLCNLVHLLTP